MKLGLYSKLAWSGIRKNRKLYIPYMLSCIGMIVMYYIIHSLSCSRLLNEMAGGDDLGMILSFGEFVIIAFALLFLIYTNSFLIRRRFKEFGLYNILGMDKKSISGIVALESVIVAVICLVCGIALGIALSKLAELGLVNAIRGDIDYKFRFDFESVKFTAELFGAVFLVLFIKSIIQVRASKPLELLKSENAGEKAPKANWIFAALGAVILGVAYYLAVSIESPLSALTVFFIAVLMVIAATYLLFISGSVALCKVLQKNKSYYYKKHHFISVSSMVYRMKRNGAGLASICILSTMVLVTMSSTASLYLGSEDTIAARFPMQSQLCVDLESLDSLQGDDIGTVEAMYNGVFSKFGVEPENLTKYAYCETTGLMTDKSADLDDEPDSESFVNYENLRSLYFISQDDYNAIMGTGVSLKENEALVSTRGCEYERDSFEFNGVKLNIVGTFESFATFGDSSASVTPSIMFIVPNLEVLRPIDGLKNSFGYDMLGVHWFYGYDLDTDSETRINVYNEQVSQLDGMSFLGDDDDYPYYTDNIDLSRGDFYGTFGGLFFVAIALSIVFMFAAAMIIYYKQVSEGYEDKSRFEIMQKVGMTKADIKKSINSQVLTVFFAPLLLAGVHLAFAFPLIWKLLQLFYLKNLNLVIWITLGSFFVFALIYVIIYRITAVAYYKIVSDKET